MATTQLPSDFKEFLRLLNSNAVEYLLIGGYAVGCHGYSRPTRAMDIWVGTSPVNAAKMVDVLREFGFDPDPALAERLQREDQMLRMGMPPVRIEVLTSISGVDFDACHRRKVEYALEDVTIQVIGFDDLLVNKRASGRLKDLADVEELT